MIWVFAGKENWVKSTHGGTPKRKVDFKKKRE